MRGVGRGGAALGRLAVEDPQRVLQVPHAVGGAKLIDPLGQECSEERHVPGLADPVAHGVQLERDLPETESREEVVGEGHDLDVEVRVGGSERLDAQLVVLAVTALLGVLVAERRRHVPGLPGRDRVVLHEGAGDGGRALGPEGHHLAVAVLEDVHLLADHLAALADAAQEHSGVLDDRRHGQAVAGAPDQVREPGHDGLPAGRLGPQHVVHALGRLQRAALPGLGLHRNRARPTSPRSRETHSSRSGDQTFLPGS